MCGVSSFLQQCPLGCFFGMIYKHTDQCQTTCKDLKSSIESGRVMQAAQAGN